MDVQFAPDDVKLGDRLDVGSRRWGKGKVIFIGPAVVTTRMDNGYTRTLLRKRVSPPGQESAVEETGSHEGICMTAGRNKNSRSRQRNLQRQKAKGRKAARLQRVIEYRRERAEYKARLKVLNTGKVEA